MIVLRLYSSLALFSWNLNGYRSHFVELQLVLVNHKPLFLSLQETHLLQEHHVRLHEYACYQKDPVYGLRCHGGAAILVHDSIHSQEIALQSTLPVVAVKVTMTQISFIACFSVFLLVNPYLKLTSLTCFPNSQPPSSSLMTSMPTIHSWALVGPVREVHFLSNYILLIISLF